MLTKLETRWPLVGISLLAWWLSCWFASGAWFDRQAEQSYQNSRLQAEHFVAETSPSFNHIVKSRSGGPRTLSRHPRIQAVLARFAATSGPSPASAAQRRTAWSADAELQGINRELKATAADLGFELLLLLDVNGYCLASSNAGSAQSQVGAYFGERESFQSAHSGRSGLVTSVNEELGHTGLYFYAPVIAKDSFVGVVVGGNSLAPFVNLLDKDNSLLSDRHGVVMLAHDAAQVLHTLPSSQVMRLTGVQRQMLYHRSEFAALALTSAADPRFPELLRLPGRPAPLLLRSRPIAGGELNVNVLWPLPQLLALAQQRLWVAAVLGAVGTLTLLLVFTWVGRRCHKPVTTPVLAQREHQVGQASDFLKQIVNAIADPLVVKDHEHRWILVNQAFCTLMGQPQQHFIGKTVRDLLPDQQARRFWDTEERVLSSGMEHTNEEKLTDGLGNIHIVVIKNTLYTDADGNRFTVCLLSDITERKQVERLLRLKEREFSSLAENLPVAVIRYDAECRRRYLNPTAKRILHGDSAELLGYTPDGKTIAASHLEIAHYRSVMEEVLATNSPREIDFVMDELAADEQEYFEVRFVPEHDNDGTLTGVLAIWHEITERKHSANQLTQREQAFRSLAESSPDYIIRCDREARYRYLNDRVSSLLKLASPQQAVGLRPNELFPDGQFDLLEQTILRVVESGQQETIELIVPLERGLATYHQIVVVPESDVNQRIVGALAFGRDITSIRESEHKLAHFIDSLPGMAFTFCMSADGRGRFPYASSAIEAYFGLMPQDVKNDMAALHALAHPEDRPLITAAMAEASRTLSPMHVESRICRPDLSERWVDVYAVPERQADGSLLWFGLMLDITARKRLEIEMKQREAEFHALAENLPDPVFRYDRDCRRLYVNPAAERVTGMSKDQLLGQLPSNCAKVADDDAARIMATIREVAATGEQRDFSIEYRSSDGSSNEYQGLLVPELDANGQVASVLTIAHDVTTLRKAERRASSFFSNMPGFAFTLHSTPEGTVSLPFASRGIEDIYGLRPEQVNCDASVMHLVENPSDWPKIEQANALAVRTLKPFQVEFRVQRPGLSERWVEARSVPERQTNGDLLWHGIMLDITERKRTEEQLMEARTRLLGVLNALPDMVWLKDTQGRYLACNPVFEEYLGFSESYILGKTDDDFADASVARVWRDKDRLVMQADQVGIDEQELVFARDGHKALIETRKIPMHDAQGAVIGLLGIGRDITAFKQTEERLRKSHDILRALAAHKQSEREQVHKELAYKIHEDLAQNLAALQINLSLLERNNAAQACVSELQTINEISQRCITRIREIVSLLRPTVLDFGLVPALEWLVEDFKGIGFQFDVALQEDIGLSDEAATVLFRAAQEALLNVALHAGATRVWVTLDAAQTNCRLSIRDNGCGFDSAAAYLPGQFGLIGLTEQVLHLGGRVLIHSQTGQGTELTILISTSEQKISPADSEHSLTLTV